MATATVLKPNPEPYKTYECSLPISYVLSKNIEERAESDAEMKSLIDFAIGVLIQQAIHGNKARLGPYFHVVFIYGSSSDDCNRFTFWEDIELKDRITTTYVKPPHKQGEMFRNCLFACAVPKGYGNLSRYQEADASAIGYPMFTAQVML